jgi:2-hydroxy-6-oxonona-2,4-dienedioate hydrolase
MNPNRHRIQTSLLDGRAVRCRVISPARGPGAAAAMDLPLLLLHGLGCSADAWEPSIGCLEQHALTQPVLAPDLPGYGHSSGPGEALGIAELADWVARFLDAQGIDRAHTAGNSMGCQIALALARRHPARVGSLVLAGPTTGARFTSWWGYLIGLARDGWREPMRYNTRLLRMYAQMGARRYLQTVQNMLADDPLADPAAVNAPCLVIRGERDAIVSEATARRLAAALPAGSFTQVAGAAHAVPFNSPEAFIRITLTFLAGADAGRSPRRTEAGGPPAISPREPVLPT